MRENVDFHSANIISVYGKVCRNTNPGEVDWSVRFVVCRLWFDSLVELDQ